MSFTQPKRRTTSSMMNVWSSTRAMVMYVRTFSFGLLMTAMYGHTPKSGSATRTKNARTYQTWRRDPRAFMQRSRMIPEDSDGELGSSRALLQRGAAARSRRLRVAREAARARARFHRRRIDRRDASRARGMGGVGH